MKMNLTRLEEIRQRNKELEKEVNDALKRVLSQFTRCSEEAVFLSRDSALFVVETLEEEGIKNVFPMARKDGHWIVTRLRSSSNPVHPGAYEQLYFRGNR